MSWNVPSRRIRLIILPFFVVIGILGGYALTKADDRLSPLEMFILIAGLVVACSLIEVLAVWWEKRQR